MEQVRESISIFPGDDEDLLGDDEDLLEGIHVAEALRPFQLVQTDGDFAEELNKYIDRCDSGQIGTQYIVCSIVGGQSSGKSTLLNAVFNTSFETMDVNSAPTQTTEGIWITKAPASNSFVLDVEGADSLERDDDYIFERRAALFALMISDIIIVNIWYQDIGRRNASCYSLVKTVVSAQLDLFSQNANEWKKTRLIVCVRDYRDMQASVEACKAKVLRMFNKLWQDLPMPSNAFSGMSFTDLFSIEVFPLRSFIYENAHFREDAAKLEQLIANHGTKYSRDIPLDAFAQFGRNMWTLVEQSRSLCIFRECDLVKAYKCNEYAQKALGKAKEAIDSTREAVWYHAAWRDRISDIVEEALTDYSYSTATYSETDKAHSRDELFQSICRELELIFPCCLRQVIQTKGAPGRKSIYNAFLLGSHTTEDLDFLYQQWRQVIEKEILECSTFEWLHKEVGSTVITMVTYDHTFNIADHTDAIDRWIADCWTEIIESISSEFYGLLAKTVKTYLHDLWQGTKGAPLPTRPDYTILLSRVEKAWDRLAPSIIKAAMQRRPGLTASGSNEENLKQIIVYALRQELSSLVPQIPTLLREKFTAAVDALARKTNAEELHIEGIGLATSHLGALIDLSGFRALCQPFYHTSNTNELFKELQSKESMNMQINSLSTALHSILEAKVKKQKDATAFAWECVKTVGFILIPLFAGKMFRR